MMGIEPEQRSRFPRWFWVLVVLAGLGLLGLSIIVAGAPLVFPRSFGVAAVAVSGYGLVGIAFGLGLFFSGLKAWRGTPSPKVHSRWGWVGLLLASVVFAVVGRLLPARFQDRAVFAPFHFALITLPGLLLFVLVNLAVGRPAAISARRMTLSLVAGAAGIFLAIPVELIGMFLSGVLSMALAIVFPGGSAKVNQLLSLITTWSQNPPTNEAEILSVVASPIILLTLVLTLAVVTPLVEELGKSLLLGLFAKWIKPTVAAGFVWGAACGLGFAWLEGISNGAIGLGGTNGWLYNVGMRFFATAMHMVASGLLGIGWAAFWRGRHWALPAAYATAVIFHGLWNFNVVLSLGGMGLSASNPVLGGAVVSLGIAIEVGLLALAMLALMGLPVLLRRRARKGAAGAN